MHPISILKSVLSVRTLYMPSRVDDNLYRGAYINNRFFYLFLINYRKYAVIYFLFCELPTQWISEHRNGNCAFSRHNFRSAVWNCLIIYLHCEKPSPLVFSCFFTLSFRLACSPLALFNLSSISFTL